MSDPQHVSRMRVLRGMRFRATVVAVVTVGLVLAVAAVFLAASTRDRLEADITERAETRARDLAALSAAGVLDTVIAGPAGDFYGQVVSGDGTVLASSPEIAALPAIAALRPAPGRIEIGRIDDLFGPLGDQDDLQDESPYRLVAIGAEWDGAPVTILMAASIESGEAAVKALVPLLAIGLPLVLLMVGTIVWFLIGRGLRPVEAMRVEAEAISATVLDRRLRVPTSGDEIERLAVTLNEMLVRIEESAVRQRRFVSDASHELKSPVAAIGAMLDAAESEGFADWGLLVADLRREDLRLDGLVKDLLMLAQLDEHHLTLERQALDIDQIIGREIDALRSIEQAEIDVSSLHPFQVEGDARALSHVFRNLLANAVRHSTEGVWVESAEVDGLVRVTISDDGDGIPVADWERVFERFVRREESRSRHSGGTGLGLTVSRAVARAMGGDVRFVAPQHGGASVVVEVPAA